MSPAARHRFRGRIAGDTDIIQDLAITKQDAIVAAGIGDGNFGFARYLANGGIDD